MGPWDVLTTYTFQYGRLDSPLLTSQNSIQIGWLHGKQVSNFIAHASTPETLLRVSGKTQVEDLS